MTAWQLSHLIALSIMRQHQRIRPVAQGVAQKREHAMTDTKLALMAHLLRRAGFGASRRELERYASQGYEATVEKNCFIRRTHHLPSKMKIS